MAYDESTVKQDTTVSNGQPIDNSYLYGLSAAFKEHRLMREFILFRNECIRNVYVVPSHSSAFKWFGVVFVHHGVYAGAIFRFILRIPANYPVREKPQIDFESPWPFHPLVAEDTGRLNTDFAFPEWNPDTNKIWQLLLLTKSIFYQDLDSLCQVKVSSIVEESRCRIYDLPADADDKNAIIFGPWDPQMHEACRSKLVSGGKMLLVEEGEQGSSWAQKRSPPHPFS